MSSRKNGANALAKNSAVLFVACKSNPDLTKQLSIPKVMRVRGHSEDKAINCTLQMQVRQEVEKLKDIASASVPAVLSTAAAMVALSTTVMTTALAMILLEDNDGSPDLSLPSPPKKTRKTSHQHQVNRQNKRKAKEAYAQALAQATMLVGLHVYCRRYGKSREGNCGDGKN
jgi:hypothetical protein